MILFRTSVITVGLASAMAVGACRTSDDPSSGRTPAAAPQIATTGPQQDELPRSPRADVGRLEKLAAAIGLADGLPDLKPVIDKPFPEGATEEQVCEAIANTGEKDLWVRFGQDRKSTRLNSSHVKISYAVFCSKKKKSIESAG